MTATAIIIPFFAPGPAGLACTVRAALNQNDVETPSVIVVDDGSPQPAKTELAILTPSELAHVRVICQTNAGPAAARNTGLDAVPRDVAWIALLDADDVWNPDHLTRAICALEQGYDFYFTDFERVGDGLAHFALCRFDASAHPRLPGADTLHAFVGDFFARNLTRSPVGTSTVVYRKSELGGVRFPIFPWAWEDLMFWLEVASRTDRVAFNASNLVRYGSGGITGVDGWRSQAELRRKLWSIQHFTNVRRRFALTAEQAAVVDDACHQHTAGFVMASLALLRHGAIPDHRVVWDFIRWRPRVIATFFPLAVRRIAQPMFGRTKSAGLT